MDNPFLLVTIAADSDEMSTPCDMRRPAALTVPIVMLLFLGSGAAGVWLADSIAPNFILAPMIGLFALPLAFIVGMHAWLGWALIIALVTIARRGRQLRDGPPRIPPGAGAFVPVSLLISLAAGLALGIASADHSLATVLALYALVGLAYGRLCRRLAETGYLPFPEE